MVAKWHIIYPKTSADWKICPSPWITLFHMRTFNSLQNPTLCNATTNMPVHTSNPVYHANVYRGWQFLFTLSPLADPPNFHWPFSQINTLFLTIWTLATHQNLPLQKPISHIRHPYFHKTYNYCHASLFSYSHNIVYHASLFTYITLYCTTSISLPWYIIPTTMVLSLIHIWRCRRRG